VLALRVGDVEKSNSDAHLDVDLRPIVKPDRVSAGEEMTKPCAIAYRIRMSVALIAPLCAFSITASAQTASPIQICGVWLCGDDYCTWSAVRSIAEFDDQSH